MIKKKSLHSNPVGNKFKKEKPDVMNKEKYSKEPRTKNFKQAGASSKKLNESWKSNSIDKKFQNKKKFNDVKKNQYDNPSLQKKLVDKKYGKEKFNEKIKFVESIKRKSDEDNEGLDGEKLNKRWKSNSYDDKFQSNKKFDKVKGDVKKKQFGEKKNVFIKSTKIKSKQTHDGSDVKKVELFHLKKKARKVVRQKIENKSFELGKKIKLIWEEVRRKDCQEIKKKNLIDELYKLVQGHVKELVFAHDTVRVLECILNFGTKFYRSSLFNEIKDDIIPLAKSKFGKRFLLKMLQHGQKEEKVYIMKSFHGKVIELIKHTESAEVVEAAFSGCTNATEKSELVQEFYGSNIKFLKSLETDSLQQLLDKNPDQKVQIINHMKGILLRVLEKAGAKHCVFHYVLRQFMLHCDDASRAEIIDSLREHVAEFLHTKDGSRIAMQCIWNSTTKDRKLIVRHLKPFVAKAAKEEHGHMVLLALFDCVDDTILIEKHIIVELSKSIVELSETLYGKKVLIYLLSHRDPYFFCPSVIDILKEGDNNNSSKKEPELRQSELKQMVEKPILKLITSQMSSKYMNNSFCLFVLTVSKHISGSCKEGLFQLIAELASKSYSTENVHIIEHPGSHFLLKQLILKDKNTNKEETEEVLFSKTLINSVPTDILKTWIACNRGCFLLVSLFESGIPSVTARIRSEMAGLNNTLQKKSFKGAEILLKKLKES